MCFFGLICAYSHRSNLSIAMVCMVGNDNVTTSVGTGKLYNYSFGPTSSPFLLFDNVTVNLVPGTNKLQTSTREESGQFRWSKEERGILLGSFYWGYLLLQIPSGWLAERFGPARVVGVFTTSVALLTILTPVCARTSSYLLLVIRIITGMCQAALTPCMQSLFSKWIPKSERSRLVSFALAGQNIGTAVTFPVAGLLCVYGFDGGWPAIFYIFGALNVLWSMLWLLLIADSPDRSPRVTPEELLLIKTTRQSKHVTGQTEDRRKTPWIDILSSKPIWALFTIHVCTNYGQYMMLTMLPTYMKEILEFDTEQNGVMSMLPYIAIWFVTNIAGIIGDSLINRKYLSILWTRKLMSALGSVIPGLLMAVMGHVQQHSLAVILLVISGGMTGFQIPGFYANYGEVAPEHAGIVYGVSNTLASIPGIVAPYVVSTVTKDATREEWTIAFYICGVIYILGATVYLLLGDADAQKWSKTRIGETISNNGEAFGKDSIVMNDIQNSSQSTTHPIQLKDTEYSEDKPNV